MRFIVKSSIAVVIGFVLFGGVQVVLGGSHCFDCGAKVGFPFPYMQEGTFATHGDLIWSGLVADSAIALGFAILATWLVSRGVAFVSHRDSRH